ncbi:MAG: DMT family transporter [bacterium]
MIVRPGASRLAPSDSVSGIYAVSLGLFLFSIQDVIIKSFSDRYSVLQIVFTRSVTALLIMLTVILATNNGASFRVHNIWPILFKGSCGFLSYLLYYMALSGLPLADAATITFSAPIMVTALSAILFRETVGWRRWTAVLLGFVAITLVVGPKGHFNNLSVVLALSAAFTYAISTISTRYIDARDSAITAAFYSMSVFLLWSIVASAIVLVNFQGNENASVQIAFLLRRWTNPAEIDQWMMVLLGFIAAGGFYLLVKAYMLGEFSAIAPFEYLYILWGTLFGFFIWQELPSITTIGGVVLLICSNLYILRREIKLRVRITFRKPKIPHR